MKRLFVSLFAIGASLFLCNTACANTFYVATSGNNSNPGSQGQPWRTLQHAVDNINPGDTILVTSGTYAGCRIGHSGQPGAPCTLKADAGASVLVNTPGPANRHNSNIEVELFDDTVRYWVIDGIESANSPRYGIDVRVTDFIIVQNCYFHGAALTGIFLAFSDHPLIQNNESAFNGEHGIYDSNSGDHPTIRGNRSHHNHAAGIHMNGDRSQIPGDGIISFAVVEKNVIYENGAGGGSGINCDGVSDSIFRNNLLYNNHASGISLYAIDGAEGSSRNKVYNNTIIMAPGARWCVNIPAAGEGQPDPTGNQVKNNILYTPDTGLRGSVLTYGSAVAGFASDYNAVVGRFSVDGGSSVLSLAAWQARGYDTHSIVAAPAALFVNPAGNNYHLKIGSPAIGAGTALAEVTDDLDGLARPPGNPYAMGCYEGRSASCSFDFDGDARADLSVWRAASGVWLITNSSNAGTSAVGWGANGDQIVPGDYDGDGKADVAVWRPSTGVWFIINSSNGLVTTTAWGASGDVPVPGDYDGDGKTDIAVWRPSTGAWFIINSSNGSTSTVSWGVNGDMPVPGDYDGDGKTDTAVWRPSGGTWFIVNSSNNSVRSAGWGVSSDKLVPGDYDGDGKTDIAIWRPSTGVWFIIKSADSSIATTGWGMSADVPTPGDYDGDGKTDIAVWRPSSGIWFIIDNSNSSITTIGWGVSGDEPVPTAFVR
jgi:parallel beta helix pectate lyase-like protein/VCBS repeat protein/uncharacterized protein DUF1565